MRVMGEPSLLWQPSESIYSGWRCTWSASLLRLTPLGPGRGPHAVQARRVVGGHQAWVRDLTLEPLSPPPRLAPPWIRPLAMGTFLNPLTSSFQIRKRDKQGSYLIGEDNRTLPHVRGNCVKHSVSRLALESEQCAVKQKRHPQQAELQVTADPFLSHGRAASRGHPGGPPAPPATVPLPGQVSERDSEKKAEY